MMGSLTSKKECMIHGVGLVTRVRGFCLRHCGEGPPCARALRGDRIEACSTAGGEGTGVQFACARASLLKRGGEAGALR